MSLYLRDATLVDWKTLQKKRGHLHVSCAGTVFVSHIPYGAKTIDCAGKLVTKSFAVAHHHLYSALARGMPGPKRTPKSFVDILRLIWWNLDKKLDLEMVRACALLGGIEAAKSGTTFIIDHHSSPNAAKGSLETIAQALDEVGLSHLLCYELSDRDGAARLEAGIEETVHCLGRRQALVGLHASFTVSDRLLACAVELSRAFKTGLHAHAAEAACDQEDCVRRHRRRVVERFARAGALDSPKTLLAHGIDLNDRERKIFRESPAWLVENPESNQNNGVGSFRADGLGSRVLIGTDGMHGDAVRSARASHFSAQSHRGGSTLDAYRRLRRAHDYLAQNGFSGDGDDNLVILDYPEGTPVTGGNWAGHVIYGLERAHVESVIARGRLIVHERRVVLVDEDEVQRFAIRQAERLWQKL